ncbi:transglycosylase SLT domain-containing protein [Aeromonas salmonicida]|uniref:transglycosylase SLT domain-containing protein n=1 Tax=Aeromonas salmonicida TaxID=645 RepID=UPI00232AD269|nr:transglycosylase SLT domain-containing protein [Aeromonas salmonicida]WCH25171.1 transglycosylase SLT domain-containing protein [Aeromonas salmonicida]
MASESVQPADVSPPSIQEVALATTSAPGTVSAIAPRDAGEGQQPGATRPPGRRTNATEAQPADQPAPSSQPVVSSTPAVPNSARGADLGDSAEGHQPDAPRARAPASRANATEGQLADQPAPPSQLVAPSTPAEPDKAKGFYLGDDGKVRRPDGTFANKVETRRFSRSRSKDADEESEKAGNPSLLARALGLLGGKDGKDLPGGETADSAGVAVGNTFWLAAKEVKGMADDMRDAMAEREIASAKDAKGYAKDKMLKVWSTIKSPFTKSDKPTTGASGAEFKQESLEAKQAAERQKVQAQGEEQHNEVVERLDALIDASKPQSRGLLDMAADSLGDKLGGRRKGKGRRGGRGGRRAASGASSRAGRTNPLRDVGDLADSPRSRRTPGRTGRMPNIGERVSVPGAAGGRAGAAGGRAAAAAGKTGRIARMAAKIPMVGAPLASVASMGGMAGGAISAAPGALATAGRGAMAMGGRAVPLIGAAMAAYDAYTGFTDEEGQRRVFGLDQAKDPTLGQKAAMGASKVLDLGGLTSGLGSLLADGAGALGMNNLQESLTFDSDSMAKGIHDAFSNDSALAAMGVKDGESATMGQNVAATVARAANLGGVVSGTASLLGGIAEDLGFDGAKDALTFDTGDLAESLFDFFGPVLGADKKGGEDRVIINNSTARYETASARQGITEAEVTRAGKQYDFSALEQANSLPAGFMNAVGGVESNGNPLAYNKSGAKGMFQLMPGTASAMGVTDPYDVQQSASATAKLAVDNARYFNKTMGRPAEGRELYLMHQQGMGGGTALMKNPNLSAVEALSKGGQKNATQAVLQNGGNLNMSADEFANMIMAKYDKQFMAQTIASERGAKALPMEKALDGAVKEARNTPSYLLKDQTKTAAPVKAESAPIKQGFSGVLDIQREQAKAAMANPADGELTAKMDPRMTEVMAKLDKTLNGMKPGAGQTPTQNNNTTNNTTNNFHGKSRGVGDHDYVRWPNSDKG